MNQIQIPQGWKLENLGNMIEFNYGKNLPKEKRNSSGRFPVYGSNGIVGYHDEFLVDFPSIIVGRKGTVGAINRTGKEFWPTDVTYYIKIKNQNKITLDFLWYLLSHLSLPKYRQSGPKSGLNRNDVSKIEFLLPPSKTQKKIVQKLDHILGQLEEKKKTIKSFNNFKKLQKSEQLLIQNIFDALISGKPTQEWREKYNVKKEWEKKSLGDLTIDSNNGKTGRPKDRPPGIPRLGITSITQQISGYVNENECKFVEMPFSEIEQYSINNGDVLVCRQNGNKPFVGKFAVYRGNTKPIIFSDSLIRFRINAKEIMPEFLVIYTNSTIGRREIEQFCTTTAGNYSINASNLKQIQICLPMLKEQEEIIRLKDESLQKISNVKKEIDRFLTIKEKTLLGLDSIQNAILNDAFTGKLVN